MTPHMLDVFYDDRVLRHQAGYGMAETAPSALLEEQERHPENEVRVRNMHSVLRRGPIAPWLRWHGGRPATEDELATVHDRAYIAAIRELCENGGGRLTATTIVSEGSWEPLLVAAGTCLDAADSVLSGPATTAFALVRPPGHHAQPAQADGYCVFSHAALVAQRARDHGVERVAIVDWDVHHGNGTQECFYDRPDVLTVSIHMAHGAWGPSHRQTGHPDEVGTGAGAGYNVNVELPVGAGDSAYTGALREVIAPVLRQFRPGLIVGACGQDASAFDPCGRHNVTMAGFHALGSGLRALADELTGGRTVLVQEGGYARSYAAFCLHALLEGLLGRERELADPLAYVPDNTQLTAPALRRVAEHIAPYWKELASDDADADLA